MDTPVVRARVPPHGSEQAAVPPVPPTAVAPSPSLVENENPLDRVAHANIAKLSGGFSPMAIAEAAFDWGLHLAASPGRQAALALSALSKQASLMEAAWPSPRGAGQDTSSKEGRADDRRFRR